MDHTADVQTRLGTTTYSRVNGRMSSYRSTERTTMNTSRNQAINSSCAAATPSRRRTMNRWSSDSLGALTKQTWTSWQIYLKAESFRSQTSTSTIPSSKIRASSSAGNAGEELDKWLIIEKEHGGVQDVQVVDGQLEDKDTFRVAVRSARIREDSCG